MQQYQKITATDFDNADYTTIVNLTSGRNRLFGLLLQTNTSDFWLKIVMDDTEVMDLDMNEIVNDYDLSSMSGKTLPWWIYEYSRNRFSVQFPEPIDAASTVVVSIKAKTGTKELYRGLLLKGTY